MTLVRSIAAAQTVPKRGDVGANVEQHVRLAQLAAQERPQVLVFPELSLTGYELGLASELAFSDDDPRLGPLRDAAVRSSTILVVGAPVRLASELHIGAFVLFPDRTLDLYTKPHLGAFSSDVSPDGIVPPAEDTIFHPGCRNPLVTFAGNTAAIAICADSLRPSHPKAAADRGATIYLTGHFSIPVDVEFRAAVLSGHAMRHGMAVVFANYGGPTGGLAASGKTAIWSEKGELLIQLDAAGAGVAVATQSDTRWRATALVLGEGSSP